VNSAAAATPIDQASTPAADLAPLHRRCRELGLAGLLLRWPDRDASPDLIWRAPPHSVAAVLIQAQAADSSSAGSDYGFAVWNRSPRDQGEVAAVVEAIRQRRAPKDADLRLVIFAKASTGISPTQRAEIDALVKATTVERFGPVRSVVPCLVATIAFDAVVRSPRRHCGVAPISPRIAALQPGGALIEVATVADLLALVARPGI
jgi:DNA ligase-1